MLKFKWWDNDARNPQDARYDKGTFTRLAALRDWRSTDLILDVGANDGRSILRWRRHLPATRIMAFEPVRSTFESLKQRTAGLENVELHNFALGSRAERRDIYLNNLSALNSFYAERIGNSRRETVEVRTLDSVLADLGVDRVQLLKIDAEGHDLEVLKGGEEALRSERFDLIQVEAGFDAPGTQMPSLQDFQRFLAPFGYHLDSITNQCHAKIDRSPRAGHGNAGPDVLVYCDAIFVSRRLGR